MKSLLQAFLVFLLPASAFAQVNCDGLVIVDPWIREMPPVSRVAAGYVTVENRGNTTATIVGIDSACCDNVAMHETVYKDGQARMRAIENVTIAPGDRADFSPGGAHIMFISPSKRFTVGDEIAAEFVCEDQSTVNFKLSVRAEKSHLAK